MGVPPPGFVEYDEHHHGVVTPAWNSATGEQTKARCIGPGRCPVCTKEWEDKYGKAYRKFGEGIEHENQQVRESKVQVSGFKNLAAEVARLRKLAGMSKLEEAKPQPPATTSGERNSHVGF